MASLLLYFKIACDTLLRGGGCFCGSPDVCAYILSGLFLSLPLILPRCMPLYFLEGFHSELLKEEESCLNYSKFQK